MKESGLRLIAFQFAGANRHAYRAIQRELGQHIELCCFELPGRGRRHAEPLLTDLGAMVTDLLGPISDSVAGVRYALFGHSMGSLLAYLTCRRLVERGLPPPLYLMVSAPPAPRRVNAKGRHRLSHADLLGELRALGGCPEGVLNDAELVDLILPVLRADFQALETYRAEPGAPLPCPITVLRGLDDAEVPRADAEAWRAETRGPFAAHDFPGGHFFLFQHARRVAELLDELRQQAVREGPPRSEVSVLSVG